MQDTYTEQKTADRADKDTQKAVPIVGFQRAVPVLLFSLGTFLALCFITAQTGSFGTLISKFLLGLFSWSAYILPVLLLLHAVFYFSDIRKRRRLSRLIFSAVIMISVSALAHAFTFFNQDMAYSAKVLYENGKEAVGGGFIGGSVAHLITSIFGSVGLIILTLTVFALYITFFFSSERDVWAKIGLKILTALVSFASYIERLFTPGKTVKANGQADKKRKKNKVKIGKNRSDALDDLYDDEYILAENSRIVDMNIPQLGIREQRAASVDDAFASEPAAQTEYRTEKAQNAAQAGRFSAENPFADEKEPEPKQATPSDGERKTTAAASDRADDVFGGNFTSFDLAMNLRLADKVSSKTVRSEESVREHTDSLESEMAAYEKKKRQEEFERKKQAALARMKTAEKPVEEPVIPNKRPLDQTPNMPPVGETVQSHTADYVDYDTKSEETTYDRSASATDRTPQTTIRPEPVVEEQPIQPVSEYPPVDTVSYRKESMNFTFSGTQETRSSAHTEPKVEFAAHMSTDTKPFAPAEPVMTQIPAAKPKTPSLTLDRTMLDPSPTYEAQTDTYREDSQDVSDDEAYEEDAPLPREDTWEEEAEDDISEIPSEERNPNIEKARKYFTLFDNEDTQTEEDEEEDVAPVILPPQGQGDTPIFPRDTYDEDDQTSDTFDEDDDEDDDLPPFDIPASRHLPSASEEAPRTSDFVEPDYSDYRCPPIDLLTKGVEDPDENMEQENCENATKLHGTLESFGVVATVRGYDRGPRITRFEIVPAQGTRVNKVTVLLDDITLALAAKGIRMEAPIPGKRAIGVEIPNKKPQTVRIRDLIEDDEFSRFASHTMACIGKDVTGNPVYGDIAKMPHLLVAGATGMGKSVCVNSMLISILFRARPDEVKLIIFDPKKVDFQGFNGIPHLLVPVVTEAKQAAGALMWAVDEMERRFTMIEKAHVKKIDDYNTKVKQNPSLGKPLPKIIIVIDELNDLMLQVKNPVETLIMRIAQKARAAGIHLIIGTQRPSVNVLTGVIKANIPSRMSCKVASNVDSRTVLEVSGAEKLLNNGDMLYFPVGSEAPMRVQGAFVSDEEMEAVMDYLRTQAKGEIYDPSIIEDMSRASQKCGKGGDDDDGDDMSDGDTSSDGDGILNDPKFLEAADVALSSGKISTALLQRRCSIGYGRAAKYIDYMVELGLVSEPNGQKPRDVLLSKQEWNDMLDRRSLM